MWAFFLAYAGCLSICMRTLSKVFGPLGGLPKKSSNNVPWRGPEGYTTKKSNPIYFNKILSVLLDNGPLTCHYRKKTFEVGQSNKPNGRRIYPEKGIIVEVAIKEDAIVTQSMSITSYIMSHLAT